MEGKWSRESPGDEAEASPSEQKSAGVTDVPGIHLVLVGSDKHTWGIVKYTHECINYIPEYAEVVGKWFDYGDGVFWVTLMTSMEALADRSVQLTKQLAEAREKDILRHETEVTPKKRRAPRTRKPAEPEGPSAFDDLRAGLKQNRSD